MWPETNVSSAASPPMIKTDESHPSNPDEPSSLTSHIQLGSFSVVVKVSKSPNDTKWPDWKLRVIGSDGSSFNIDSAEELKAAAAASSESALIQQQLTGDVSFTPPPPEQQSLVRIVPCIKRNVTGELKSTLLGRQFEGSPESEDVVLRASPALPIGRALVEAPSRRSGGSLMSARNSSGGSKGRGKIKYDIRWADASHYSAAQKRELETAPWPKKLDPVTGLPVVFCHKCYLENHTFEQCETTYPKGRWVYWRHFKCGASYIRGHVFPPRLVAQWVDYHVSKQGDAANTGRENKRSHRQQA